MSKFKDRAEDEAARRDREDSDWYAREAGLLFADGAQWASEQEPTDEAVERAARALYETDRKEYDGDKPWPPRPHFIEDMYRERARAALTAATGDE